MAHPDGDLSVAPPRRVVADIGKLENAVQSLTEKVEALTSKAEDERKLAETYRTSVSWIVTRPFRVLWRVVARK